MVNSDDLCAQFATILHGKSNFNDGICSVSLQRDIKVTVQDRPSKTVVPVGVLFESLDQNGVALNLAEVAVLEQEIPAFMQVLTEQGLVVSALHNHWLYMNPTIMYIHIQSVEPPLDFAKRMAYAFSFLSSYPVAG